MTKFVQLPQSIDANVTIIPPSNIEIKYRVSFGWYITIDRSYVEEKKFDNHLRRDFTQTRYWENAGEPLQWLIDHDLIVTKAYKELDKAVKKVQNTNPT